MGACTSNAGAKGPPATTRSTLNGEVSSRDDSKSFDSLYKIQEVIGTGAFSVVRAAVFKKGPKVNEKVAVKVINKEGLPAEDEKDLKQEVHHLGFIISL